MTILFTVMTILVLVTLGIATGGARAWNVASAVRRRPEIAEYPVRLPKGIFFARSHTWLNLFP